MEKPLQANGREWLLVQVSGDKKNTKNALAVIDEWVEQHDPDRTPCEPDSAATISTTPPTAPHSTTNSSIQPKDSPKTGQENRPSNLDNRNGKMPPKSAPKPPQLAPIGTPSEATLQPDTTPPDDHQDRKTEQLASTERLPAPRAAAPLDLLTFLQSQPASFKCSPEEFHQYLSAEDIETLQDLVEAVEDEEVLTGMIAAGIKKFKRGAFKKAVASACGGG